MRARGPGQSLLLLLDVADALMEVETEYVVIGATATSLHGTVRATTDADALIRANVREVGRIDKAFRKAGFTTEVRHGGPEDPIPALLAVADRFGNRVDLLAGLRGLDPEIFSRYVTVAFRNAELRIVGREDLVAMKCFAGGPQDLADASSVLANRSLDIALTRRLARRFGPSAAGALERLLKETGYIR